MVGRGGVESTPEHDQLQALPYYLLTYLPTNLHAHLNLL